MFDVEKYNNFAYCNNFSSITTTLKRRIALGDSYVKVGSIINFRVSLKTDDL